MNILAASVLSVAKALFGIEEKYRQAGTAHHVKGLRAEWRRKAKLSAARDLFGIDQCMSLIHQRHEVGIVLGAISWCVHSREMAQILAPLL
ncbi:hypothetical protein SAOR_09585 [Salinisphaera orenii MK-B5]|uniref:Uncharacterized protein n=1 Tax=Salinisphaera orenii MK-B5 TaxID=856730 RepID=A0A423PN82_9GAMM|nr:hypothetical protein SAOR_09585 [Salinisphaera orenii MK-B5]